MNLNWFPNEFKFIENEIDFISFYYFTFFPYNIVCYCEAKLLGMRGKIKKLVIKSLRILLYLTGFSNIKH